ncbi:MAG: nucleotidyl transferase AbiEii/AbiGii toxin family protein [Kiritimatiellae bacterium]|nr:nucleotidyl transferase AbiEii/AbiGii toxin family protein [Kiritimatiellia bacterium]
MPISDFQMELLRCIAANRSPESYLAGATVLNRASGSPRFSQDIDLFHDLAESVTLCAEQDATTLAEAGYAIEWSLHTGTFHRAVVTLHGQQVKVEWAQDSAFRFFPVQKDAFCGYRLHDADAATNKILALANRSEIRDFVDVLHLHQTYLTLGALVWAACGKDPGFTPEFLLDQVSRHTAYTQADVDRLHLKAPLDLKVLKRTWLDALSEAQKLAASLPTAEVGCFYLNRQLVPVNPDPSADAFPLLLRHRGSVRGAWPTVE